jgi:uncharacterized protein YjbI with pentapeptide repeats
LLIRYLASSICKTRIVFCPGDSAQALRSARNYSIPYSRKIVVAVKTFLGLFLVSVFSQTALAYLAEDVQRLLETNSCAECDLSQASFREVDLKYANLNGADLKGADLRAADLGHANIDGSNFSGADLSHAQLDNVNLKTATFRGANLSNVDLTGADLSEMDLTGANLRKAILVGTNLVDAKLIKADLSWAYLYKAKLIGADLSGANLDSARLSEIDLTEADLFGARIDLVTYMQDGSSPNKSGISIRAEGDYREITSFDLNGASKYMTSKSGQLYKSNDAGSSLFGDYVRSYPDLLAAYKKSGGKLIEVWGERHWETFGKHENRSLRGIPNFEVVLDFNKNPKFRSDEEVGLLSVASRDDLIYLSYTIKESEKDSWDDIFLVVDEYNGKLKKLRTIIKIRTASFAHVAGTLTFDQLGYLYLSVGEGRLSDYESQDINSLLGKILRIDVSKAEPKAKIIAYGLRNPWKISIDSKNRMFIGDCGEATIESVYLLNDLNPTAPYNLGWPVFEGSKRVANDLLRFEDTLAPIYEYKHHSAIGNCVIGGFFLDDLGVYVFGDYLGRIRFLKERQHGNWYEIHSQSTRGVLSLGMDTDNNRIYMSSWDKIYEIKISRDATKFLPRVTLCRTVMPNRLVNSTDCD